MGSNLWRRSYILSTLILVFWTSRSLYLNNSSIWDHKHNNYRNFTKNNLWESINDLCHELYFSSWKYCLGTSYVYYRFRNMSSNKKRTKEKDEKHLEIMLYPLFLFLFRDLSFGITH